MRVRDAAIVVLAVGALAGQPVLADEVGDGQAVVEQMTDAINNRDLDALDELVASDLHRHSAATPGLIVENLQQFKDFLKQDFASVPDSHQEITHIFGQGDWVAVRAVYRGTQKGAWGPFPASNKSVELPFIGILRIEDGKIAEIWVEWDNLSALQQLGHLGPPDADGGEE